MKVVVARHLQIYGSPCSATYWFRSIPPLKLYEESTVGKYLHFKELFTVDIDPVLELVMDAHQHIESDVCFNERVCLAYQANCFLVCYVQYLKQRVLSFGLILIDMHWGHSTRRISCKLAKFVESRRILSINCSLVHCACQFGWVDQRVTTLYSFNIKRIIAVNWGGSVLLTGNPNINFEIIGEFISVINSSIWLNYYVSRGIGNLFDWQLIVVSLHRRNNDPWNSASRNIRRESLRNWIERRSLAVDIVLVKVLSKLNRVYDSVAIGHRQSKPIFTSKWSYLSYGRLNPCRYIKIILILYCNICWVSLDEIVATWAGSYLQ